MSGHELPAHLHFKLPGHHSERRSDWNHKTRVLDHYWLKLLAMSDILQVCPGLTQTEGEQRNFGALQHGTATRHGKA